IGPVDCVHPSSYNSSWTRLMSSSAEDCEPVPERRPKCVNRLIPLSFTVTVAHRTFVSPLKRGDMKPISSEFQSPSTGAPPLPSPTACLTRLLSGARTPYIAPHICVTGNLQSSSPSVITPSGTVVSP